MTPTGVAGLTFQDEADAANAAVAELADKGVKTSMLVIHQGGFQAGSRALNGCAGNLAGSAIADIAAHLDPSIKVIVSAHTHAEYRCTITTNGVTRLITSASSFGRVLSDITLTIDERTASSSERAPTTSLVTTRSTRPSTASSGSPTPRRKIRRLQAVVNQYVTASAPLANKVIGKIQGDLTRTDTNGRGETTLGDVIADAQFVATHPAALGGAESPS